MTRKITILGATGSIGKSTLDLIDRNPERFEVSAVTAATNVDALAGIARRTRAKLAVIADENRRQRLQNSLPVPVVAYPRAMRPSLRPRLQKPTWSSLRSSAAPAFVR